MHVQLVSNRYWLNNTISKSIIYGNVLKYEHTEHFKGQYAWVRKYVMTYSPIYSEKYET